MAEYFYDALGRRVAKRVSEKKWAPCKKTKTNRGRMLGKKPSVYTVAFSHYVNEDKILLARSATGFVTLYLDGQGTDEHLGEISLRSKKVYMTDHLGSVLNSPLAGEYKAYGAFGTSTLTGKVLAQIRRDEPVMYGFTGREYDAESGLYYYRARMYDAELGRFLIKDPIGFDGGDTNLYGYILNDPINFVDPEGTNPIAVAIVRKVIQGFFGLTAGGIFTDKVGGKALNQGEENALSYQRYMQDKMALEKMGIVFPPTSSIPDINPLPPNYRPNSGNSCPIPSS